MVADDLTGLGRLHAPDRRDLNFALAKPREASGIEYRYWITNGDLDQGPTSRCVAYAGVRFLTTNPIRNKPIDAQALYDDCQANDEWPGSDYNGTSVRALFRVLKQRGLCSEYRWAWDAATVIDHVLAVGPVVVGTAWTLDMFTPDRNGFIAPTGQVVGGHAWTIIGASRTREAVRMINSWGPMWGDRGRAWVQFEHLDKLIKDDGEACTATEVYQR